MCIGLAIPIFTTFTIWFIATVYWIYYSRGNELDRSNFMCWRSSWQFNFRILVQANWKKKGNHSISISEYCTILGYSSWLINTNLFNFFLQGFWLCIIFGRYVYHLYVARLLAGCTGGGLFVCIPLFVAEISEDRYDKNFVQVTIFYYWVIIWIFL